MKKRLNFPSYLGKNFWDVDIKKLDIEKHATFILERILEFGDEKAVRWLFKHFTNDKITDAIRTSRNISLKSANFWSNFFNLDKSEVLCLSKQFQKRYRQIWKY
jgi:hypothetical protein